MDWAIKMETLLFKLNQFYLKNDGLTGIPNTDHEIIQMKEALNIPFNPLFYQIIKNYGSCFIGIPIYSYHQNTLFGNDTLLDLNHSFREISSPDLAQKFLAISHDGCGNYLLIGEWHDDLYLYDHETHLLEQFYGGTLSEVINDFISGQ